MLPEPLSPLSELPFESGFVREAAQPDLPGISIIMPIYNVGPFLEKTLRSLLLNDLSGCEVIVMDGGSTDDTLSIIDHYRQYLAMDVVSERDEGQSDAINKGFARASKPILTWLNGDDLYRPNALNPMRAAFRDNPGTEVVVGDASLTELDLTPIRRHRFSPETLTFETLLNYAQNHLVQPSVFFSRTAWDACGPVRGDLHYAMDADLFLSMAKRFPFHHVPVEVALSVYHEACKTRLRRGESIAELAYVEASHGGLTEARALMGRLVKLYNDAAADAARAPQSRGDAAVLERRIDAMEKETRRNLQKLLSPDIVIPS